LQVGADLHLDRLVLQRDQARTLGAVIDGEVAQAALQEDPERHALAPEAIQRPTFHDPGEKPLRQIVSVRR
jgi:hypothetical protein